MQETIEKLSLQAWPAYETKYLGQWLLRYANGYTKRANSVTVLGEVEQSLAEKIAFCESFYQARNCPAVFRLPSFTVPDKLDALLARRGYKLVEPTQVMVRPLDSNTFPARPAAGIPGAGELTGLSQNLEDWLREYSRLHGIDLSRDKDHKGILQRIDGQKYFAAIAREKTVVACGLGVLQDNFLGLFDIVSDRTQRRRGYASMLIDKLFSWAMQQKADSAYLQVVSANEAAINLYKKLQFQTAYRYWYRVQDN